MIFSWRETKTFSYFALIFLCIVILLILSSCSSRLASYSGLKSGDPVGYVEFFSIANIDFFKTSKNKSMRDSMTGHTIYINDEKLGRTRHPELPFNTSNVKLAWYFTFMRVTMPLGEHTFRIEISGEDFERTKITESSEVKVNIIPNRMTLVRLDNRLLKKIAGRKAFSGHIEIHQTSVTLPIPPDPEWFDEQPNAYNDLLKLVKDNGWGFRFYAAKRLGFIGKEESVEPLKMALSEEDIDVVHEALVEALERISVNLDRS